MVHAGEAGQFVRHIAQVATRRLVEPAPRARLVALVTNLRERESSVADNMNQNYEKRGYIREATKKIPPLMAGLLRKKNFF